MPESLAAWLAANVDPVLATASLHRIGTGHSRAMYRVTGPGGIGVVVRVEQGGVFGTSSAEECTVMRALHDVGYPVARILAQEPTGEVLGQPFFVMELLEGTDPDDGRGVDRATAEVFVDLLARLHALDGRAFGFDLVPPSPSEATPGQVRRWLAVFRSAVDEPNPLIEEAAAWLIHHAPPLERLAVVHGDAGPGNFVHAAGSVVGVTDWEFAHLGDPTEDYSFCLTMRGARTMSRAEWLEVFSERAGFETSAANWRYWEAFNLFKGACANRTCLPIFADGRNRAPNMAIIGTALHQLFLRRLVEIVHAPFPPQRSG